MRKPIASDKRTIMWNENEQKSPMHILPLTAKNPVSDRTIVIQKTGGRKRKQPVLYAESSNTQEIALCSGMQELAGRGDIG